MSINQTHLYDSLQALTQQPDVKDEFIYGFLDAYGFAKSTITQIRNGGVRNVAKVTGDIALKGQLYFRTTPKDTNVHEAAESLKDSDAIKAQKIRFIIVTNFHELVAYDLKANERMETLLTELHQQYAFFLPLAGIEKSYTHTESVADVKAAEKMGQLFDLIRERNKISTPEEAHALNVFLTRLLFCFFAEDTGIFGKNQFTDAIKSTTQENGDDLSVFLCKLFSSLNEPRESSLRKSMPKHLSDFPYVNGGLFETTTSVPVFGAKSRRLLLECSTLDWSQINPDIFGSMFQAVIDEDQRGTLGQHYTSVSNIIKVIKPLFLDKLLAELERSRGNAKKLQALLERIASIKVFDPACGSGNFLIIAYKEMRRLEMEVFRTLNEVSQQNVIFMTGIKLSQFYGIEIDDFAHEIALLSLWLAEHQMNQEFEAAFGLMEPMLPLKASGNIVHGNSLRLDWAEVCPSVDAAGNPHEVYICGNPPFHGNKNRTEQHIDDMAHVLGHINGYGRLDFVASWLLLGAKYSEGAKSEVAFVVTNSLCQGEQVSLIWPEVFKRGLSIAFAYSTFEWKNQAKGNAGVHVAVIGISSCRSDKQLFTLDHNKEWLCHTCKNISPYLSPGPSLIVSPSRRTLSKGVTPMENGSEYSNSEPLILSPDERASLQGKPEEKWVKKLVGASEFINAKERYCLWMVNAAQADIESSVFLSNRIEQTRAIRLSKSNAGVQDSAKKPHLFKIPNHPESGHYILVPRVSSVRRPYVPIGFLDSNTVATNKVQIIPNGSLFEFGIITSEMHMDWMRAVGGRLKSDYSYSATLVYNTYPWPDITDAQRKQIEALAEDILMARENYPDKPLAYLYDPDTMPNDLMAAHKALDDAVERLYRRTPFRDAVERLEHLFARYETLIAQESHQTSTEAATKKPRKPREAKTAAAE